MSIGSRRVTVRVGDDLLDLVDEAITRKLATDDCPAEYCRSDWIIEAIKEKLNKGHRSSKRPRIVDVVKVDDNAPRIVEEREA